MAHDIFVSYSSEDKPIADTLVAALESSLIRCWYAPRDIRPGANWGEEIVEAISASKVFLVIFSESANKSQHVLDELNLAISNELTILPFRIEKLEPSGAMQLHLSARHWLDAYSPSWEKHIDNLVNTAESYIHAKARAKEIGDQEETVQPVPSPKKEEKPKAKPKEISKPPIIIPKTKEKTVEEVKEKIAEKPSRKKPNPLVIGGVVVTALVLAAVFVLPGLSAKPEEVIPTETFVPTQVEAALKPSLFPNEIPEAERTLADSDASMRADEHRVLSGDNFLKNLYERPFTAIEMDYQPDLDIYTVDFSYDDDFFYFVINLYGVNQQSNDLTGLYGIEFDLTLDGRGDLIVYVENVQDEWTFENVFALTDTNDDVGGEKPIDAEENFEGTGYDQEIFLEAEKVAFSRLNPEQIDSVQIAVSRILLDSPEGFLWGAWADDGLKDFTMFDYNDSLSVVDAGSPFNDNENYPITMLYSLDNTCRLPYGTAQENVTIPGVCISVAPVESDKPGTQTKKCPPGTVPAAGGGCVPFT